ncbi:hypothetical protein FOXG_20718 [Fusarium oxysporum f. sp. lycopersici 4287]|uniref:Uncharacterized protein n=1 Tax=Fusarium oxysporum f. sp. lycopersici (strain 4287 / CBS 123668 / FGSC 9935 / NRRL 34936) TaxID=426428 RepID=A0A0J9WRN4_FUSO4|nr:hypothetical protein FOXG_20718 [Fusarium oxysporum f. sp. lycopersici 4287]KNB12837.1 hypothetical protein FOXG_20718 [Fusarium oxysporum f. sp. lycopersici 4287]
MIQVFHGPIISCTQDDSRATTRFVSLEEDSRDSEVISLHLDTLSWNGQELHCLVESVSLLLPKRHDPRITPVPVQECISRAIVGRGPEERISRRNRMLLAIDRFCLAVNSSRKIVVRLIVAFEIACLGLTCSDENLSNIRSLVRSCSQGRHDVEVEVNVWNDL